jgi:hypothetical protein
MDVSEEFTASLPESVATPIAMLSAEKRDISLL